MKKEIRELADKYYSIHEARMGSLFVAASFKNPAHKTKWDFTTGFIEGYQKALEERPSDFYCGEEEDGIEDKCKVQCNSCVTPIFKQLKKKPSDEELDTLFDDNSFGQRMSKIQFFDAIEALFPNPKENA